MKRLVALALLALALVPAVDRLRARRSIVLPATPIAPALTLAVRLPGQAPLASWATVGGCGAGGSSASAPGGGIQWVGRHVTGGLVDAQALTTQTFAHGNQFTAVSTRLGTSVTERFGLALNVPVLYKVGDVTVLGATKTARLSGFGDLSLELSYKLGAIGAHQLMLIGSAPTGSHDAVRQGIVLPQHLQLGAGVPGATLQYQHTRDRDWGLVLVGATANYAGWENSIGDWRSPSATAYGYAGYILGRWVPSAGLTLFGKPMHDRERGADRPDHLDPLMMVVPSLALEWSSDWIAVLPAATVGISYNGLESVSLGLGISSSLF
ncbi:MAG TPA: hypothetical protein VN914_02690 [Polyangia bacterium]|nr:hypothetical protein [Polyangia bacterium]